MDYSTLRAELQKPEYANLSDQAAADMLNTLTVQRVRRVPISELMETAYRTGLMFALLVAQRSTTDPMALAVIDAVLMLKDARFEYVDVYAPDGTPDPATSQMFDALCGGGVMIAEQRAALEALAWESVPVFDPPVTALDVHRARDASIAGTEVVTPPVATSSETLTVDGLVYSIINLREIGGAWYQAFSCDTDPGRCLIGHDNAWVAVTRAELRANWATDAWVVSREYS